MKYDLRLLAIGHARQTSQSVPLYHTNSKSGINPMLFIQKLILIVGFIFLLQNDAAAKDPVLTVANTLQSNMVIQQGKPLVVWGTGKAGMAILVKAGWQPESFNTTVTTDGKWEVAIPVPMAKPGVFIPNLLSIHSGNETKTLFNILIGDVWLCSGQSNMDMELKPFLPWLLGAMHYRMEIENANYPQIRLFNVRTDFKNTVRDDCGGHWSVCSPATAADYSALAYFFARELFVRRQVPIGLVVSSVGGSSCQAWTSRDTLTKDSSLYTKYLLPYDTSRHFRENPDSVVTFEKVVHPTVFYNAMIYPLRKLQFSGALWYQGESNRYDSSMYTRLNAAMVRNWRDLFSNPVMPFYYVQVAPYNWQQNDTTDYDYALLREAQAKLREVLDHTGMAVTMDIADPTDIHPRNKQDLAYRLSKIALANFYKVPNTIFSGPEYKSHTIDSGIVKVQFSNAGSGLVTNDGLDPKHFYLAGNDGIFYYATARIVENEIWLQTDKVSEPVAIRYAFTNYPVTNFENREGFPAIPFRSSF